MPIYFVAPSRGDFDELILTLFNLKDAIFQSENLLDNIIMFQSSLSKKRKLDDLVSIIPFFNSFLRDSSHFAEKYHPSISPRSILRNLLF